MTQIRVNLDNETTARLARHAVAERRPIPWQAEVMLRRALGLAAPPDITCSDTTPEKAAANESV